MRFCANVSMLFAEVSFLERFELAAGAGFSAVEFWWPSGEDLGELERKIGGLELEVVLFNFDAGEMAAGDRGLLGDPDRHERFRENVPVALGLAERLGCRRLNALVGLELPGMGRKEQLELARKNVAWAADLAANQGALITIEALNTFDSGPYLLSRTGQAAEFIESVGRPNLKLQYDAYHMQRMEGNLVANLHEHVGRIAHVQVADSPGRGEPGTGEINYRHIFETLEDLGYDGYVGLEYNPTTEKTEDSLGWLPKELRSGDVNIRDLGL